MNAFSRLASLPLALVRLIVGCGVGFAVLTVVTAVNAQWFEKVTGMSPDGGSGGFEWELVAVFGGATIVCLAIAGAASRARRVHAAV